MSTTAANKGARLLDRVMPQLGIDEWWNAVSISNLDISSLTDCVLGQLFTDFTFEGSSGFMYVKNYISERLGSKVQAWIVLDRNGFSGSDHSSARNRLFNTVSVSGLNAAWAAEIKQRRAGQ